MKNDMKVGNGIRAATRKKKLTKIRKRHQVGNGTNTIKHNVQKETTTDLRNKIELYNFLNA